MGWSGLNCLKNKRQKNQTTSNGQIKYSMAKQQLNIPLSVFGACSVIADVSKCAAVVGLGQSQPCSCSRSVAGAVAVAVAGAVAVAVAVAFLPSKLHLCSPSVGLWQEVQQFSSSLFSETRQPHQPSHQQRSPWSDLPNCLMFLRRPRQVCIAGLW